MDEEGGKVDLRFGGRIGTWSEGERVCDKNPRFENWGDCETREKGNVGKSE